MRRRDEPHLAAVIAALLPALVLVGGCGGSSSGADGGADGGTGDSDADADADSDADADGDADTDADTEQDSGVLSCPAETDAGPWEWEDQPQGEDCGPDCEQVTFSEEVRAKYWDMWDNLLVYVDDVTRRLWLVDMAERKQMKIPAINPELAPEPPPITNSPYWPAIFQDKVLHGWSTSYEVPEITERNVIFDTTELILRVVADHSGMFDDIYGDVHVYEGKSQEEENDEPRVFLARESEPCEAEVIAEDYCVSCGIWEQTVIWVSGGDVRSYDLETSTLSNLTPDDNYQMWPKIHGRKIVFHDLRFGDNDPLGNWNHSAVFVYDIDTEETTQITSGDWVACYPDVHDEIVVWADYRACDEPNNANNFSCAEIWGYNLSTEQEFQVTDLPGRSKQTPRIWDDKVYVHMMKEDPSEDAIYRFDLPPEAR